MSRTQTDDRRILNAFEAGYLAGQIKLKQESAKRKSKRRKRTLFGWLRLNSGPLTVLMGFMASITTGAWTVYTYYRPPTNAIVEPFDSPGRNRKAWPGPQPTPNDKPEELDQPGFRLLIDNVPQRSVPKPVQNVLFTAADLMQEGYAQAEVDQLTAKYLATMGIGGLKKYSDFSIRWNDWRTAEIVSNKTSYDSWATIEATPPNTFFNSVVPKDPNEKDKA